MLAAARTTTTTPRAARAAPRARDRRLCCRPVAFRPSEGADQQQQPPPRPAPTTAAKPPPATTTTTAAPLPVKPLTTAGAALTAEESASLARVLELAPTVAAAGPAAAFPPAPLAAHLYQTLESAAEHASSPDLPLLEGAILAAEQLFLQQQQQQPASSSSSPLAAATAPSSVATAARSVPLWQPVFASSGGWPRLLFIPVPEYFCGTGAAESSDQPAFDVVTELGPLLTHFYGERRWSGGAAADGGSVLEYEVRAVRLEWVGSNGSSSTAKPPAGVTIPLPPPLRLKNALSFFAVTPRWACARSRLGGTMLLRADPPAGRKYNNNTTRR
jgi:hypothetical protein